MIYCTQCGRANEQDAKFCVYCRALLERVVSQPAAVHPGPERSAAPAPTTSPGPVPAPAQNEVACRSCGAGNEPTRTFCRRCGNTLASVVVRPAPPPPEPGWRPPSVDRAKLRGAALLIVAFLGAFTVFGPVRGRLSTFVVSAGRTVMRTLAPNVAIATPVRADASSNLPGHEPAMLIDNKSSAWAAPGAGQRLTFVLDPAIDLASVYFVVPAGSAEFTHPSQVEVRANAASARATLAPVRKPQRVKLEVDDVSSVTVEILSVGDPSRPVALLEVALYAFE